MYFDGTYEETIYYTYRCKKTDNLIRPISDWYKKLTSEDHDAYPYCDCPKKKCREIMRQIKACSKWNRM